MRKEGWCMAHWARIAPTSRSTHFCRIRCSIRGDLWRRARSWLRKASAVGTLWLQENPRQSSWSSIMSTYRRKYDIKRMDNSLSMTLAAHRSANLTCFKLIYHLARVRWKLQSRCRRREPLSDIKNLQLLKWRELHLLLSMCQRLRPRLASNRPILSREYSIIRLQILWTRVLLQQLQTCLIQRWLTRIWKFSARRKRRPWLITHRLNLSFVDCLTKSMPRRTTDSCLGAAKMLWKRRHQWRIGRKHLACRLREHRSSGSRRT